MKMLERLFESLIWNSRFVVLFAVVASLAASIGVFYMATVDTWIMLLHLGEYASPDLTAEARLHLRAETITHVVEIIDGYLLATVLLIFALGLYELFISKIELAEDSHHAPKILQIESLDDLKTRLAKVVLMILIVRFFEHALQMAFTSALDLLYFAAGIALLGGALYLTHAADGAKGDGGHP